MDQIKRTDSRPKRHVKKERKFIKRLERVVPEIAGTVLETVTGHEGFGEAVEDIAEDVMAEFSLNKRAKKERRLFSIRDLDELAGFMRLKDAALISEKFTSKPTHWLVWDFDNGTWRLKALVPPVGIKKATNIEIGSVVTVEHLHDATFSVKTDLCELEYDDNDGAIINYKLLN